MASIAALCRIFGVLKDALKSISAIIVHLHVSYIFHRRIIKKLANIGLKNVNIIQVADIRKILHISKRHACMQQQ